MLGGHGFEIVDRPVEVAQIPFMEIALTAKSGKAVRFKFDGVKFATVRSRIYDDMLPRNMVGHAKLDGDHVVAWATVRESKEAP